MDESIRCEATNNEMAEIPFIRLSFKKVSIENLFFIWLRRTDIRYIAIRLVVSDNKLNTRSPANAKKLKRFPMFSEIL
jgi:hypothetical protein